jgi:hypothetical protein
MKQLGNSRRSERKSISDEELNPARSIERLAKKQKFSHYTAEVVVELENKEGHILPIRALLDTGTSSTDTKGNRSAHGYRSSGQGPQ